MKILVVTPKLPWPPHGADEADRVDGIRLFQELGHEVRVIAKVADFQKGREATMSQALGVIVDTVPYVNAGFSLRRFNPLWFDGASYEYTEPLIRDAVARAIDEWTPDVLWLDESFSWPLVQVGKERGIRTIVRSVQIESTHLFVDEGPSLVNAVKWIGKELGERTLAHQADAIVPINKNEEVIYRRYGAKHTSTVPLRSLPWIVEQPAVTYRDTKQLRILFSGATFSVAHNRAGAIRVLKEIAPALEVAAPGVFTIHMTGGKLPEEIQATLPPQVRYEGYVKDYGAFLSSMDVAITPGLGSVGMHQKLFEPLARGLPTVTVPWALAGYPFEESVLFAQKPQDVVEKLLILRDRAVRQSLGESARTISTQYFSRETLRTTLAACLRI